MKILSKNKIDMYIKRQYILIYNALKSVIVERNQNKNKAYSKKSNMLWLYNFCVISRYVPFRNGTRQASDWKR